jgi:hypothetical protein
VRERERERENLCAAVIRCIGLEGLGDLNEGERARVHVDNPPARCHFLERYRGLGSGRLSRSLVSQSSSRSLSLPAARLPARRYLYFGTSKASKLSTCSALIETGGVCAWVAREMLGPACCMYSIRQQPSASAGGELARCLAARCHFLER